MKFQISLKLPEQTVVDAKYGQFPLMGIVCRDICSFFRITQERVSSWEMELGLVKDEPLLV